MTTVVFSTLSVSVPDKPAESFVDEWRRALPAGMKGSTYNALAPIAVGYLLANYADDKGEGVAPSLTAIVAEAGTALGTLSRAVALLQRRGYLVKVKEHNAGSPAEYRLTFPSNQDHPIPAPSSEEAVSE